MENFSSVQDLIDMLEAGNRYHISIVFFNKYGNEKTRLRPEHVIHATPFCDAVKLMPRGLTRCLRCKQLTVERVFRTGKAFGGLCINGVYEYCHPVKIKDELCCILFIGNIVVDQEAFQKKNRLDSGDPLLETMEYRMEEEDCRKIAEILDSYIRMLMAFCPATHRESGQDATITALKGYLDYYFFQDVSLPQMARLYNYNEKYLGRLFKQQMGISFAEYLNARRLEFCRERLSRSNETVLDISMQAGFNNVTYFNRLFRRRYGMTPTQFRQHGG